MTPAQICLDPLRGTTPLWKVAILYSVVGGGVLELVGLLIAPVGPIATRAFALVALAYGAYVTLASYRCAGNCPWPQLSRLVRLCCLVSLIAVPFIAYLILTGGVALAT